VTRHYGRRTEEEKVSMSSPTTVTVRQRDDHAYDDRCVWVDMTDDTDGPVTRVTKLVAKDDDDYVLGRSFALVPIPGFGAASYGEPEE
jgi:hypothetical protein